MYRTISFLMFFHCFVFVHSQQISAFSDYRNYFFAFDKGMFRQLENHPVKEFKVGGNCIAYVDNANNLKVYYKGIAYRISDYRPDAFFTEGNMVVFRNGKILSIFDGGETSVLTNEAGSFMLADSLIAYVDGNKSKLMVQRDNKTLELEGVLVNEVISIEEYKVSDNLLAYINYDSQFKIYYRKESTTLETTPAESFIPGKNIVAYVDNYSQNFKVYYKGETEILEAIKPESYQAGDDLAAYVDRSGNFKIYYKGNKQEISTFAPEFYKVEDELVMFYDRNYFQVFFDGNIYPLEKFTPSGFKADLSTLAYADESGYLKIFSKGKQQEILKEKPSSFEVYGNTVSYRVGMNEIYIFSESNVYSAGE